MSGKGLSKTKLSAEESKAACKMEPQCNPDGLVYRPLLTLGGLDAGSQAGMETKQETAKTPQSGNWTRKKDSREQPKPNSVPQELPPRVQKYADFSVVREDIKLIPWTDAGQDHDEGTEDTAKDSRLNEPFFASQGDRAFLMHNLMSPSECQTLIQAADFHMEALDKHFVQSYRSGSRALLMVPKVADQLYRRLVKQLQPEDYQDRIPLCFGQSGVWVPLKLNECFKVLKYDGRENFIAHRDGPWVPREDQASIYTVLFYLSDEFLGGETALTTLPPQGARRTMFGSSKASIHVVPVTGSALFFNHDLYHAATSCDTGGNSKWVAKTELIMQRVHSYHVDRYHFYQQDQEYAKMKALYEQSQAAMQKGEKEQFVGLYQDVVALQRAAMLTTQQRRFEQPRPLESPLAATGGSGAEDESKRVQQEIGVTTRLLSLFQMQGHFISAKLNADVLGDILGFLTASEVVRMLPISQGAYFSLLQSDTWRRRLEDEFPEVVRYGDPSVTFFAAGGETRGSPSDNKVMLLRMLKGESQSQCHLQSPPEGVEASERARARQDLIEKKKGELAAAVEAEEQRKREEEAKREQEASEPVKKKKQPKVDKLTAAAQQKADDEAAAAAAAAKEKAEEEAAAAAAAKKKAEEEAAAAAFAAASLPGSGVGRAEFDWYTLYLQRRSLTRRFHPFGLWLRRNQSPLLVKSSIYTRSSMFSQAPVGARPRPHHTEKATPAVGSKEDLTVLALPAWYGDPAYGYPLHLNMPDSCRVLVQHERKNQELKAPVVGVCTMWHPKKDVEDIPKKKYDHGRDGQRLKNDVEWSVLRAPVMDCVDTVFHPMLLIGLPQWWLSGCPGQEKLLGLVEDCFELTRVPAIRLVHPAVAAVAGQRVATKSKQSARQDLSTAAAAFVGVVSIVFEEKTSATGPRTDKNLFGLEAAGTHTLLLYLTIVDVVDMTVVKSVALNSVEELAGHKLLDVTEYNATGDGAKKTKSSDSSGQIQVFYQNIDGGSEQWAKFVEWREAEAHASGRKFLSEEVTLVGLQDLVKCLDFREKCIFRPVA